MSKASFLYLQVEYYHLKKIIEQSKKNQLKFVEDQKTLISGSEYKLVVRTSQNAKVL